MLLDGKCWRFCCVWLFQILPKISGVAMVSIWKGKSIENPNFLPGKFGTALLFYRSFIVVCNSHPYWWFAVLTVAHSGICFVLSLHPPPTHTILRFSCDFPLNAALQFLWLRYEVALTVLQMGNCEMQILKQADSQSRFLTYLWFKMMLLVF